MSAKTSSRFSVFALPALAAALALLPALIEWLLYPSPGDSIAALFGLWAMVFLVPLLCVLPAYLRWPVLPWVLAWMAAFFPAACITLNQLAHELTWSWLAIGQGGLAHWSRVALCAAIIVAFPSWALVKESKRWAAFAGGVPAWFSSAIMVVLVIWLGTQHTRPELSSSTSASPAASAPNILLLSIDTLRQDALSAYGGPASALDPWLEDGIVMNGWAPAPWTQPSMHALFRGSALSGAIGAGRRAIPASDPWWPERLAEAGYRTAARVSNPHLTDSFGFSRGFTDFDHADQVECLRPAARSVLARWWTREWTERRRTERGDHRVDAAVDWLEGQGNRKPWFLWTHLLDPHLPYVLRGEDGREAPEQRPMWVADLGEAFARDEFFDLPGLRQGRLPTDEAFVGALKKLYATEVDYVAHHAARLLDAAVEASGERPLIWILTSDHGEEFFEHGGFEHGHTLFQELLRVPMVIGGVAASHLPRQMRLQDVGPWLLAELDLPSLNQSAGSPPEELLEAVIGSDVPREGCAPTLLATSMLYGEPECRFIASDGSSWWRDAQGQWWFNDACLDRLDQALSPGEVDSVQQQLFELLELWRGEAPVGATVDEDSALRERLRALGYLGG